MVDVIRILTRKNSLRTVLRELSLVQIEKIITDLDEIYKDILNDKQAEAAAEEARQRKIIELKALMLEAGIAPQEIINDVSFKEKKIVKSKYRLIDSQTGKKLEWTGRGRTPVWIIDYENKGGSRESLLIKD